MPADCGVPNVRQLGGVEPVSVLFYDDTLELLLGSGYAFSPWADSMLV